MKINNFNNNLKANFVAMLLNNKYSRELAMQEISSGRYKEFKLALQELDSVHKSDVVDVRLSSDKNAYIVMNKTNGCSDMLSTTQVHSLTDVLKKLADPGSVLHRNVFNCKGEAELNDLTRYFYFWFLADVWKFYLLLIL